MPLIPLGSAEITSSNCNKIHGILKRKRTANNWNFQEGIKELMGGSAVSEANQILDKHLLRIHLF